MQQHYAPVPWHYGLKPAVKIWAPIATVVFATLGATTTLPMMLGAAVICLTMTVVLAVRAVLRRWRGVG